ncbi:hypothetical protein HPULCUR_006027 [Helicostylum pulchrum]|uniref:WW domain-containing protein n=1 Tax=Helicostylum pulchrum TaxID=562976 RepID=A0ABP9Y0W5_9FUNG
MSYNNKRYKRQEDDNNHLPQVFQRLGSSSSRPNTTTTATTYTGRTQRYNEGGGLRIARYNSSNANSPQHTYPDYSKISQLREDAVYYSPSNEYVYNQPIQTPTNNFRFVRSDPSSSNDVSRPIISFLRDSPAVSNQSQSPPSPPSSSSYNNNNNTHYNNTHQMNSRRVVNEQDHIYQKEQQQEEDVDMQEQTYNDRINIDIAKKIRITASIPTSNMSNDHLDNNDVGSNINNNNHVKAPKRHVTVTTTAASQPRKDRSSSSEPHVGSKGQRPTSPPVSRTVKRTRSPSPLSEAAGQSRRPRRLSVTDYASDEEIPFLHLKSDTYVPNYANYAKEDNINNRLSGVKKFKDLRSYPLLGSTTAIPTKTAIVSHNKVWKKPECTTPLPLSKKFTPGATTKTVDVTRSNMRLTPNSNANQSKETTADTDGNDLTAQTKKHAPSVAATSTEHANAPAKVGTAATIKPVTAAGAKPVHAGAKSVTTTAKMAAAPFNPVAAPFHPVAASSKDCAVPVKYPVTPNNGSASTPAASVTSPTDTSVNPTAEKNFTSSPKKPAETSIATSTNAIVDTSSSESKDIPGKTSDKPVKPVSFIIKLSTETNKAFIETASKSKKTASNKATTSTKSRWDALPSSYTNLEKQNNVAENNSTVCSDTSVSTTVKHGIENQSRDISKATGSSVSQGTGIRTSSNEQMSTGFTTTTITATTTTTSGITTAQQDDALIKQQKHIKQDEIAKKLLRQMSIDEREDVVMDIEPPPARNRPAPILNIHNQCKRYQPPVITILKEEPVSDHDMEESEQDSVYNSLASAMQNTVDTIMGEFIGSCTAAAAEEKNKQSNNKKLPVINTQQELSNEQARQLISPPVSSTAETSPVALPSVAAAAAEKPKATRSRLPAPWKVRMTDSGEIFYLNSVTGETTPTRPV